MRVGSERVYSGTHKQAMEKSVCATEQSNSVFTTEHLLSLGVKFSEQNCHLSYESASFLFFKAKGSFKSEIF